MTRIEDECACKQAFEPECQSACESERENGREDECKSRCGCRLKLAVMFDSNSPVAAEH